MAKFHCMQKLAFVCQCYELVQTTVGRVILFDALPEETDFSWVNKIMKKSDLTRLVERIYYRFGSKATVECT